LFRGVFIVMCVHYAVFPWMYLKLWLLMYVI
jgi:hypothetical protein